MKKQMKKLSVIAATVFMLTTTGVYAGNADADKFNAMLAKVNAAADKAASVGGEWRDTRWKKSKFVKWKNPEGKTVKGSYVGIAEMAAKAGDYKTAMKLLDTALFQSEMGYKQAMEQKSAGPRF
jgi:hypothetical protein